MTNNFDIKLQTTSSKELIYKYKQTALKDIGIVTTLIMAFRTLGVIYGDIGTSPLYVYTAIFPDVPNDNRDITIIPMIKYIFIVLRADDNGQGGTFALYSLLFRNSGLSVHDEQRPDDLTIVNYESMSTHSTKEYQNFIKRHKFVQNFLTIVVLLGASLIMSDGLLTPAISVISAVEGIAVASPPTHGAIVYISCGILIVLFAVQRFGTNKVGGLFAPIVFLWFVAIASIGIWNITFDPKILRAFNPYYIFDYFIRNKGTGFEALGGVLLSITGVEALYADLGHFNRVAIQLSFPLIVYPSLVLAYLGQAARLTLDNTLVSNTFYNTIPNNPFIYWVTFVLATLATIIASQAMISATFSLISQAMQLDSFPRVKIVHTSKKIEGQVYIPEINYILMVAVVIVCFAFQESAKLTIAYGVAVASVMFITTILLSITIHVVWGFPIIVSIVFFLIFGVIDMAFLSSTLLKVRNGGWFTLTFGVILTSVMLIWRWGTNLKYQHELDSKSTFENIFADPDDKSDNEKSISELGNDDEIIIRNPVSSIEPKKLKSGELQLSNNGYQVSRLPGIGMFYNGAGYGVPLTFKHFVHHFPAVPKILIFISIRHLAIPFVGDDDRLIVKKVRYNGCYRIIARYGYMEVVSQGEEFITKMIQEIRKIDPNSEDLSESSNPGNHVTYILDRQSLQPKPSAFYGKKVLINCYVFMENISRELYGNWNIPINDVVDVGMKIAV
ncbi:potassium transporter [Rhizophagus irregularis DAOM 181602=DAOM 197198]|uniref:Potassium transporter n=1 Tax=Rhizophagus irregularis (strain DAOM 181602 / DAOM 197198 / MUCL 43194) TaxID=747089 RepID=A0A2P4PTI7_RHIID|nr:potassium transporter [Rhizophagus irregularis DAOM 181602=DAOM 197198]POG68701.1 potassium transporter [Rhizophagus irregularis DAOM 181602=DAOM 197198]CAG8514760.1 11464_t:CDS:2 [Rhizophagus irregularis]|eukprot:XP_025175567.1 potassium transporter [Rhizophagus irregularis DAOM 181602=DAOM 197198]